jgi:peptide/nickel transport system substrate-binding protein
MKSRYWILMALALVAALVVGACGTAATPTAVSPEAPQAPEPTSPTIEEMPTEPPEVELSEPFVLRTTWGAGYENIDCLNFAYCWNAWQLWESLYDGLVDMWIDGEGYVGRVADSWERSDDGLTWTFHLRDLTGATFHDGTPFTAEDIAWTINYYAGNEAISWLLYTDVSEGFSAEAVDDRTVEVKLVEPLSERVFLDALVYVFMLPKHIWEPYDAESIYDFDNAQNIGTGPFRLVEWEQGQYMILDAHEGYFMGKPPIDRVILQEYVSADAAVQALIAGEIDHITYLQPDAVDLLQGIPEITVIEREPEFEYHMNINVMEGGNHHPALSDLIVRQAIAQSIDKQQLVDTTMAGRGIPPKDIFDGGVSWNYWSPPDLEDYAFDTDLAASMLQDAGYVDSDGDGVREMNDGSGTPLTFRLYFPSGDATGLGFSEQIAAWMSAAGMATEIEAVDDSALPSLYLDHDYDLAVDNYAFTVDVDYPLSTFTCDGIDWEINFPGYCSAAFDDAYYAQRVAPTTEERQGLVFDAVRVLHDDVPYIQLAFPNRYEAYRNDRINVTITDTEWYTWGWWGVWGYERAE